MDKTKDTRLNKFVNALERKMKPEKIVLFGSRARGDFLEESDYDIMIVSDFFKGMTAHARIVEILKLTENISMSIEPLCLTPEEFKTLRNGINLV